MSNQIKIPTLFSGDSAKVIAPTEQADFFFKDGNNFIFKDGNNFIFKKEVQS